MPTRDQVLLLLVAGLDYTAAAEWLGIPAGQAYLIATGRAADGSGSPAGGESPGDGLLASSQHLANPPQEGQRHRPGSQMVTTTHDPRGGRPRLIAALGGQASEGVMPREFDLVPGVTTIGSDPQADVHLEGLDPHHAEIRRDERDEYVYIKLGAGPPGRVDGQAVSQRPLRTGDRIEIGGWTLSYFREEFADHGIPGGGRHGGDPHPVQPEPRPRGTSPEGGSDRTADDPGEYF